MCFESISTYKSNWYRSTSIGQNIKYFQPFGLNSGVILFNTTRWRQMKKTNAFSNFDIKKYFLSDQDVFNIYFQTHRDEIKILPMSYNFRGNAISGNAIPIIKHYPGTGCAGKTPQCGN